MKKRTKVQKAQDKYYLTDKGWVNVKLKSMRQRSTPEKCNIDQEYLLKLFNQTSYCPILGLKLERHFNMKQDNSYSIDRIDSNKGYIKGNIQIISELANRMKNNATPEMLLNFADWIKKNYKR